MKLNETKLNWTKCIGGAGLSLRRRLTPVAKWALDHCYTTRDLIGCGLVDEIDLRRDNLLRCQRNQRNWMQDADDRQVCFSIIACNEKVPSSNSRLDTPIAPTEVFMGLSILQRNAWIVPKIMLKLAASAHNISVYYSLRLIYSAVYKQTWPNWHRCRIRPCWTNSVIRRI
jgi:hypothetical protein